MTLISNTCLISPGLGIFFPFVRATKLLFSFHHHVFAKNCFQPALRSGGFLGMVCMTCRAILNCQPCRHHCLPSWYQNTCWPVTPPVPVLHFLLSTQHGIMSFQLHPVSPASLFFYHLLMLWTMLNFSSEGLERICVTFKVKLFCLFFTNVFSTCPLAWNTKYQEEPVPFYSSSMALQDQALASSQAPQWAEHYLLIIYMYAIINRKQEYTVHYIGLFIGKLHSKALLFLPHALRKFHAIKSRSTRNMWPSTGF